MKIEREKEGNEYVFELEEAKLSEVGNGLMSGLDGDDDLNQLHRFRPEQIHRRTAPSSSSAPIHHLSGTFRSIRFDDFLFYLKSQSNQSINRLRCDFYLLPQTLSRIPERLLYTLIPFPPHTMRWPHPVYVVWTLLHGPKNTRVDIRKLITKKNCTISHFTLYNGD